MPRPTCPLPERDVKVGHIQGHRGGALQAHSQIHARDAPGGGVGEEPVAARRPRLHGRAKLRQGVKLEDRRGCRARLQAGRAEVRDGVACAVGVLLEVPGERPLAAGLAARAGRVLPCVGEQHLVEEGLAATGGVQRAAHDPQHRVSVVDLAAGPALRVRAAAHRRGCGVQARRHRHAQLRHGRQRRRAPHPLLRPRVVAAHGREEEVVLRAARHLVAVLGNSPGGRCAPVAAHRGSRRLQ
mmetsp:Transcript_12692/g.48664  ORF Transcript_12692/g.48664 Transcript_12692/m.48664 type:complete len:241 (+) Transcript_12692:135-857(+)